MGSSLGTRIRRRCCCRRLAQLFRSALSTMPSSHAALESRGARLPRAAQGAMQGAIAPMRARRAPRAHACTRPGRARECRDNDNRVIPVCGILVFHPRERTAEDFVLWKRSSFAYLK